MTRDKILITGASGQLGYVLVKKLQKKYGIDNIIASDIRSNEDFNGLFKILDASNFDALRSLVIVHKITQIYHLAAILSANAEKQPLNAWNINMKTFFNVLEISRLNKIEKVFFPSSIAVFGDDAPKYKTPQKCKLTPITVYGMSKVAGENWAQYYFDKYALDIRSLRYPGVIGHQSLPNGGTTDYAVEIYHKAIRNEDFECYLNKNSILPMIYMEDVIRATMELMEAPSENISIRTSYNLSGMSFSPKELTGSIKKIYPNFNTIYKPDFRQEIADSWPSSIDDSFARKDWNWKPCFDIDKMTKSMIHELKLKQTADLQNIQ